LLLIAFLPIKIQLQAPPVGIYKSILKNNVAVDKTATTTPWNNRIQMSATSTAFDDTAAATQKCVDVTKSISINIVVVVDKGNY
jgi:hypothetical protein